MLPWDELLNLESHRHGVPSRIHPPILRGRCSGGPGGWAPERQTRMSTAWPGAGEDLALVMHLADRIAGQQAQAQEGLQGAGNKQG